MDSLNRMALELADEALDFADELRIGAVELDNGATVLDFGVEHPGGLEASLLLAELQTAGLATLQTRMDEVAGAPLPHVEVAVDDPAVPLLCSQKASWEISMENFEGLGSGPARALVAEETEFRQLGYTDAFDFAVLTVETDAYPDEEAAAAIAERAGVEPGSLFLAVYPTASVAGSVTGAARAAELAVFRLTEAGYDPTAVDTAAASAPVAPVAESEDAAIGRTNDALAYGGQVHLTVSADAGSFAPAVSTAREAHGRPLTEVYREADWDFSAAEPGAVAPAQVTVSVSGGPTHALGETDEEVLAESFGF
jgi:methenyltetrahydromethanopterin cyclohydrolase